MAVKYQKARFLIAGSLAAAVVGGTAYFGQPVTQTPAAADAIPATTSLAAGSSQVVSDTTTSSAGQTTSRVTTTKAKKSRGS